jgi:hypothetical protein
MKRLFESRLAPAIAVALIGVIAVAGIAIAGSATSSKKHKKGLTAAKVSAIADQRIAAAAPNLAVKSAGTAGTAGSAETAGTAGSLRMFGHVSDTGVLSDASGIGFATFSTVGNPLYCIGSLATTPRGGEVTADANEAGIRDFPQLGLGAASGCPSGTQAYVTISNTGTGNFTDSGFFVEFWS